ncbi:MAG: tRNA (adenosine(37)-N6)-threonylcarbamoyltransferase complex dimerization subunit type 1 TsaB, partial [Armatimonadetes bacterium]|nr:tRNA (adenosine(37)-N6)-threonylcarbamoyltransferase complex dimerization subunit type 1 TsaB [Armatimonadota bacterium]
MRVLGLETATPYGSVAVVGPDGLLAEVTALIPMRHLEWLLPAVERTLAEAGTGRGEIEGLAVSIGPGGFTGLRIGIATAAAWARAADIPVIGVSTLEALAATVAGPGLIAPVLDAKRGEVAAALFRREGDLTLTRLREDTVLTPDRLGDLLPRDQPVLLLGDGLSRWADAIGRAVPAARWAPPAAWAPRAAAVAH